MELAFPFLVMLGGSVIHKIKCDNNRSRTKRATNTCRQKIELPDIPHARSVARSFKQGINARPGGKQTKQKEKRSTHQSRPYTSRFGTNGSGQFLVLVRTCLERMVNQSQRKPPPQRSIELTSRASSTFDC
jgi:hypothetical protein